MRTTVGLGLALLGAAVPTGAEVPATFERAIPVSGPGMVAVRLDRHVYEAARPDLGDLRVIDQRGANVAYVLDRGGAPPPRPARRPRLRNRGRRDGGAASLVLDFEERVLKSQLTLRLSGDNFRRRVIVEGSDDGREWSTLTDEAWVFAIPGPEPARHETVALPENDFPLLRVTVIPGSGERGRLLIEDAWLRGGERPPRREETLVPRWSRVDELESRETWLVLDLGARHQPFQAVVLAVADERFHREATLEVREDVVLSPTDSVAPPVRWNAVGRGVVYRLEHEGEVRESLRLDAPGRARAIRVRLHNRDDRPLDIEDVSVRVPVERLLFEAGGEGGFRLTYGAADLAAPEYDLARSLDPEAEAAWADLGPPARRDVVADVLPWSERHPALLWLGLLVVVAGLGALTWRSLRSV